MARARTWTCRRCGERWHGNKKVCTCGALRPPRRVPKHQQVLDLMPYEEWVERFGERCGICGRPPGPSRKLDRDHCHATGEARGLLCHSCNRGLGYFRTAEMAAKALTYLQRHEDLMRTTEAA